MLTLFFFFLLSKSSQHWFTYKQQCLLVCAVLTLKTVKGVFTFCFSQQISVYLVKELWKSLPPPPFTCVCYRGCWEFRKTWITGQFTKLSESALSVSSNKTRLLQGKWGCIKVSKYDSYCLDQFTQEFWWKHDLVILFSWHNANPRL